MRLLLLKPSSLGDIIHGLQAAQALKTARPGVRLTWVARDRFAPLVEVCPAVDEVLSFQRRWSPAGLADWAGRLQAGAWDEVWDWQGLARTGLMILLARADLVTGRRDAREGAAWLCDRLVGPPGSAPVHALDRLLAFLPGAGVAPCWTGPLEFRETVGAAGSGWRVRPPEYALLFPDSRRAEKEWPGFVDLTDALLTARPGLTVVWAGSGRREGHADWPSGRFINMMGSIPLDQLPGWVSGARVVVANDSGPSHLAAALHRPVAALFGPTDPARFGPYPLNSPRHRILRDPTGRIDQLTTHRVVEAVLDLLTLEDAHPVARLPSCPL